MFCCHYYSWENAKTHVEHLLGTTEELSFRPARDLAVTLTYRATVERWVETLQVLRL